jgi:acetolactate synthase-1/2/3 large subunit
VGIRIDDPKNLRAELERGFAMENRLVFFDIVTDQTENVYPMIAQGKAHNDMHMSPHCVPPQDPERELS